MADEFEHQPFNVLFLCTGNSARSIMGEVILNTHGKDRFRAFSAGAQPRGTVHPRTLQLLTSLGYPTAGLRSKSWDEFGEPDAPEMDFVFTVCDDAAAEVCPAWPGHPMTAHWGVADPAAAHGSEAEISVAFAHALRVMRRRIEVFTALPIRTLDHMSLKRHLDEIGAEPAHAAT